MSKADKKKRLDKLEAKVLRQLIAKNIKKKDLNISAEEVQYFKENPYELDRITSTVATKKVFLMIAVVIGTAMVAVSIAMQTRMEDPLFNGLITDLLFEGGVALWGAAITVYMLEILMHRQEIVNRQYRLRVLRMIKESEEGNN